MKENAKEGETRGWERRVLRRNRQRRWGTMIDFRPLCVLWRACVRVWLPPFSGRRRRRPRIELARAAILFRGWTPRVPHTHATPHARHVCRHRLRYHRVNAQASLAVGCGQSVSYRPFRLPNPSMDVEKNFRKVRGNYIPYYQDQVIRDTRIPDNDR